MEVSEIAALLKSEIDAFVEIGQIPHSGYMILSHSMGGLIARSYLEEHGGAKRVDLVITLATPHHGSPLANGPIRFPLTSVWSQYIGIDDHLYWSLANHCWKCGVSPDKPNRSDLRWDNLDRLWGNAYESSKLENNKWLRSLNEFSQYDQRIIAYYGEIGNDPEVELYGSMGAPTFHGYLLANLDFLYLYHNTMLRALGVVIARIMTHDARKNITFLQNDGMVPSWSGSFFGAELNLN